MIMLKYLKFQMKVLNDSHTYKIRVERPVEANSTEGQGSRRAVAPSDDDKIRVEASASK
jgi:hypothetical protein